MLKSTEGHDAVVVGGGFAGAVAARELARAGRSVALVEARDRLGGRTWLKPAALAGLTLEMGGTWIDPRQRHSWAEAQRYGAEVGPSSAGTTPTALWLVGGRLRSSLVPVPVEAVGELERLVHGLWEAARPIDPRRPLAGQDVDHLDVSLADLLAGFDLSPDVREVAGVFLRTYGSAYEEEISALHLLRRLAAAGSMAEFALSGASHPLVDGTGALLDRIVGDAAVDVLLSSPVERIEQDGDGVRVHANGQRLAARVAVVTVPPGPLGAIAFEPGLDPARRALAEEGVASRGLKLWALARNVPDGFAAYGAAPGIDSIWCERRLPDGSGLLVAYGPSADELDGNDPAAVQASVRTFLPDAEVTACASHDWANDRYALETWDVFRPGQIRRFDGVLREPAGRVVFAGSYTACAWPGFIDGAIESGFRAAADAARLLA